MKLFFVILTLLAPLAANATSNCEPVRQGLVTVSFESHKWQMKNGDYQLVTSPLGTIKAKVDVLKGRASGCVYPVLASVKTKLDGDSHEISVSGLIYHSIDNGVATKHLSAGYHLDRGISGIQTNETASTDIYTEDLGLKKISVALQSKLDSPGQGVKMRDGVSVDIRFEDTDAP